MDAIYQNLPLNALNQDIRLISVESQKDPDGLLQCRLEVASLCDFRQDCEHLFSKLRERRERIAQVTWLSQRSLESEPHKHVTVPLVPDPNLFRFSWGDFAALSYTWGNPNVLRPIRLNGVLANCTVNLVDVLETLQSTSLFADTFRIWIDALCINQNDIVERTREVQRMRSIYSLSWSVFTFLGKEGEESNSAIELLERLADYHGDEQKCLSLKAALLEDPAHLGYGCWKALNQLTLRPYWSRLWIIQEIVLAGSVTYVCCGDKLISWTRLCQAVGVIHTYLWKIKTSCAANDRGSDPLDQHSWENSAPLHHIWKDLWVLSQTLGTDGHSLSFRKLIEVTRLAQCSDPRDKVFGMLGMMSIEFSRAIMPDYNASTGSVFTQAAKAYISVYNDLEFLHDANPWGPSGTPSWAPDWAWRHRYRDSRPGTVNQISQDSHVDDYSKQLSSNRSDYVYQAAAGLKFEGVKYSGADNELLICQCIIIDELDGLAARAVEVDDRPDDTTIIQPRYPGSSYGDMDETSRALASALYSAHCQIPLESCALLHLPHTEQDAAQAFTRSVNWPTFANEGTYYRRWERWLKSNGNFVIGGRPLITYFDNTIPTDAAFEDYWNKYENWVRTIGGRRLATTVNGRFAWISHSPNMAANGPEACPEDVFAVFPGCYVPILLRKVQRDGIYNSYQVLGEAYVLGFMNGEIADLVRQGHYQAETVTLC